MKKLNRRWLIAGCVVFLLLDAAIVVALGVAIRCERQNATRYERDALAQQMQIPPESDEKTFESAMMSELGEAYRCVSMNSEPQSAGGKIRLMLSNAEENAYAVKMQLILFSTGEMIAETGLVDPGWRVEETDLLVSLVPGEHQCFARLYFYTKDGTALLGTMGRQVLLRAN